MAKSQSQEPAKLDETIEGGKYLNADNILVDCNGIPLRDKDASSSDTSNAATTPEAPKA